MTTARTPIRSVVAKLTPRPVKRWVKRHFGRHLGWPYYCPVCENWVESFGPYGRVPRPNALCPVCRSLERHRAIWVFLSQRTNLLDGSPKKMLHVAPEPQFQKRLRNVPGLDYLTADFDASRGMVQMDITDIRYPDDSFDVVYCSHVLEHVLDDRKATRELRRVLKPTGWAVLSVPVIAEATFEDPSITDPTDRLRIYGQEDHVRRYGPDFRSRLEEDGFHVQQFTETEVVGVNQAVRFGVSTQPIYYCKKRASIVRSGPSDLP